MYGSMLLVVKKGYLMLMTWTIRWIQVVFAWVLGILRKFPMENHLNIWVVMENLESSGVGSRFTPIQE